MVSKKIYAISFIFSILILLVIGQVALGQNSGIQYKETAGLVEITTPELAVKVTAMGTVPHFHFWDPEDSSTIYHVMFPRLFEVNDVDDDGEYNKSVDTLLGTPLALPSTNWDVSNFSVEEDGVHFNFTQSPGWGISVVDLYIQICVHVYAADTSAMKFDLIISGWDWQANDSLLVLEFTLGSSTDEGDTNGDGTVAQVGNQFQIGEGYMEYAEQAQAGNTNIQVRGTIDHEAGAEDESVSVYLAFENFGDTTLYYDPTIGISSVDDDGVNGDGETEAEIIGSPAIWIGLIGGVSIASIFIIHRIRTKN